MPRPIRATIDNSALRHNLSIVRRAAPGARTYAVIKANAYGHGLLRAARAFESSEGLAILEFDNAVRLREAGIGKPVLLLEGCFDVQEVRTAADLGFVCALHDRDQIAMLADLSAGQRLDLCIKLNTGMNRLGMPVTGLSAVLEALEGHPRVGRLTLMTHFACADDERGVADQWHRFCEATRGLSLPCTAANSAAILRYPQTHGSWVRPGIMLYGASPFADVTADALGLRPALTLSSEIIAVQALEAGDAVGYGASFVASRPMRVGIVACGYADGYPRHAPSGTPVLVDGHRTGTVGRVSMDMMCVDLTDLPAAGRGSAVVLFGDGLPADEVAAAAGTISYELFCALASRVPVVERG